MGWVRRSSAVLVLLAAIIVVPASPALAADQWVKVADGGLGLAERRTATALAIYRDQVYVASHHNLDGVTFPSIFRAPRANDSAWTPKNPDWGSDGEVTDLLVFGSDLYVSTSSGRMWRLGAADSWAEVPAPIAQRAILAMAVSQISGMPALCVAQAVLAISCSPAPGSTAWTRLSQGALPADAAIGSIRMRHYRNELYVGLGGSTAGSRHCEVWAARPGGAWRALTKNCFGHPGLTWVPSMQEFDGWLYMGTAGHEERPVVMRTRSSALAIEVEDVTPYGLYDCENEFGTCPVRYGSMAATRSELYVGTRTTSGSSMGGDVNARNVGGTWRMSNTPGFGETNDAVSSMTSDGLTVYAGTLNPLEGEGFQVWRRSPTLSERYPEIVRRTDPVFRICGQLCRPLIRNLCVVIVSPCTRVGE